MASVALSSTEPPELTQARQYFDALDYEQAMPLLDRAIGALEPVAARDPARAATLVSAYEMRARARFGTGNRDGAMTDFKAALAIDPGFTLAEGVSPRIVALLDEVKASTLGAVELTMDPPAADVSIDGVRRKPSGTRLAMTGRLAHDCGEPAWLQADRAVGPRQRRRNRAAHAHSRARRRASSASSHRRPALKW